MRGSRYRPDVPSVGAGSIPACAGQPSRPPILDSVPRVYPRVCGAAQFPPPPSRRGPRSIPACAGQPIHGSAATSSHAVYPRVCGAAYCQVRSVAAYWGLSPRVRGSLGGFNHPRYVVGSIPACAGQPVTHRSGRFGIWVYPRVCGAAVTNMRMRRSSHGLSPRVRGSRLPRLPRVRPYRSIPACAGQPPPSSSTCPPGSVYPRVCGAASGTDIRCPFNPGLSPRVRGSLHLAPTAECGLGSIPACAGQPVYAVTPSAAEGVYPRVCGAAP